jgi:hypothetical protein
MIGCKNNTCDNEKVVEESFDCKKGEMTQANYAIGINETIPNIQGLQNGFLIIVDTNNKATNFISFDEYSSRKYTLELDTSYFSRTKGWEKLTSKQKIEKVQQEKISLLNQAESFHKLDKQGKHRVWIINNTRDTVTIQMQDWSFICVLQAKTKSGQWYPIQYWQFSFCGSGYYYKHFPPNTGNSFINKLPNKGDYITKLRYKLLGADKFYYSNEFDGRISYCEFVEDSISFKDRPGPPRPHFKLDSLINMVMNK